MSKSVVTFISLSLLFLFGCDAKQDATMSQKESTIVMNNSPGKTKKEAPSVSEEIAFVGKVVYIDLEGGFWAIVTDQGGKLDGKIPEHLKLNNQKVSGFYKPQKDMMSFHMWGTLVIFSQLKVIGEPIQGGPSTK